MQTIRYKRTFLGLLGSVLLSTLIISCNRGRIPTKLTVSKADSAIFAAGAMQDYERMRILTDSFEMVGDISELNANRWRGVAYYRQGQYRMAENFYWKAFGNKIRTAEDQLSYDKVARRLSEILLVKGDYEGSLRVAIPAVKKMKEQGIGTDIDYAILLNNIGCCQLNLGQDKEAHESFAAAREHYANRWKTDSTSRGYQEAVIGTVYTSLAYINKRHYSDAIYWIDRTEMLLNMYRKRSDARKEYFDEYQGRIEIMRAVALQGLGGKDEAVKAYQRFLETNYSKTSEGHIHANDYLVAAKRYKEAADNYSYLNQTMSEQGKDASLDNIQLYLLPKYQANAEAGRKDTARAVASYILSVLDDAITNQKSSTTAELATIYDTQGKAAEIAQQQRDLAHQRFVTSLSALGLLVVFFTSYIYLRHRSSKRLKHAHEQLQNAYDKLEETTTAKERIESELRIAKDIQESLLPNKWPDRKGLDLYALMSPARQVGGDLYDYQTIGNTLYFCLGDVSGKGVPASLFMAQVSRLFRVLSSQGMNPNEIATRLNDTLADGNDQGMFVTMFLGKLDLLTGKLDYCNAGHNPPVLDGKFMEMETNAPIGLWQDLKYVGESVGGIKGKPLFIYSDGLNEAENQTQRQFGDERMLELINATTFVSAQSLIESMEAEVEKFRDGAEPNDDMTMLCLKLD